MIIYNLNKNFIAEAVIKLVLGNQGIGDGLRVLVGLIAVGV